MTISDEAVEAAAAAWHATTPTGDGTFTERAARAALEAAAPHMLEQAKAEGWLCNGHSASNFGELSPYE